MRSHKNNIPTYKAVGGRVTKVELTDKPIRKFEKAPKQKHQVKECNKVSFSKRDAATIVNNNLRKGKRSKHDETRYYYCPIHNAYHLTSKDKSKREY